ncbi:MAG: hypothetical protein HQ513_06890 [Rhodospirillales bacterium]|nr:hypothetical protein [Rhodospirillales bacterium]
MHKKIIEKALAQLTPERATYFGSVAGRLEKDPRIEDNANLVYSVLKDVMADLPVYLDEKELINQLLEFTDNNYQRLKVALFDPKFIHDPASIRSVTGAFVHQIVKLSLEKHENGEIQESPLSVHQYTWPYRDTDIVDPDDEEDEWNVAIAKNEKWLQENGGVDRRSSGAARVDGLANKKPEKT